MGTAIITPWRFAYVTGHGRSSLGSAAKSRSGAAIPWYTYPAIDFLAQREFAGKRVLEFGGGQSTLWWARRAASVVTIEEDESWYQSLKERLPSNVELHHVPADRGTRSIAPIRTLLDAHGEGAFDVIVIDGHLRRELTGPAFEFLAPRGALLFDNSEGYGFYEEVKSRACCRIDFYGFAPGVSRRHCTSLVFVGDCFLLEPHVPIANIELIAD
ncbi:MAG: hypothetical protein ACT4OU_03280 [Hyphomicrobium sp.]